MTSFSKYSLHISALIAFVLFVFAAILPFISRVQITVLPPNVPNAGSFHSRKQNVWADLSGDEARELTKFLFSKPELNLTESSKATEFVHFSESRVRF